MIAKVLKIESWKKDGSARGDSQRVWGLIEEDEETVKARAYLKRREALAALHADR